MKFYLILFVNSYCACFLNHEASVLASPALLGNFLTVKVPGIVHHEVKVCIVIDGHRHIVVVLAPLFWSNFTISGVRMALHITEVVLECVEEFTQDLVLRFLAGFNVWVLLGIVSLSNIVDVELARFI